MKRAAEPPPYQNPQSAAARELGSTHRFLPGPPRRLPLLENFTALSEWIDSLETACADPDSENSKAAEWLLDNKYQIKRSARQLEKDLPPSFYRRLPQLDSAEDRGLPRVFCLTRAYMAGARLQISQSGLIGFVRAYQEQAPLTIAELWAVPSMLRLLCLETVIVASASLFPALKPPFMEQTCQVILELHEATEAIARALGGLRIVSSTAWKDFFDCTSRVEARLCDDPSGVYGRMDFETRDRYRKVVEKLAHGSGQTEQAIVEQVLKCAESAPAEDRRNHVGHCLLGSGRSGLERLVGYRPGVGQRISRWFLGHAGLVYAWSLSGIALASLVLPLAYLRAVDATLIEQIIGLVLSVIPASILSVTIVHWAVMQFVPPRILPKLDLEDGIPPDCKTAVVVPVIVARAEEVPEHIENLELHWLANPDPNLRLALLSDLRDADSPRLDEDEEIESALSAGIRRLNERHGAGGQGPFNLLHRARIFNPGEGRWMAWERKRGKLEQLNRFVLGDAPEAFPVREGEVDRLRESRFIVTVDADTVLTRGSVARLAGTLAHPLNAPDFDPDSGRLRSGYTVIQPRVEILPESSRTSLFSRIYAGDAAIDIYSRAVSNVYQDLFGSAVYVGKGIYDVEAFHRCLDYRVPENTLLSHDLLEGAHGRVALASDVVLYDGFPATYIGYTRRWQRWVRGDWQLLPWLGRRVPDTEGGYFANPLGRLERWKIIDNLRRSLIAPALVVLALAGWLVLPGNPWVWTVLAVAAPGAYLFTDVITGLARGRRRGVIESTFKQFRLHAGRWLLAVAFLLHDALVALDAIGRTLWRLIVSRNRLLEWTSAAHTAVGLAKASPRQTAWREMWPASAIAVLVIVVLGMVNPAVLPAAGPLLLLWFAAPEIAAWVSGPRPDAVEALDARDRAFLRGVARRTWLFFERFVGPEGHWLPPDNFQDDPQAEIAHRTSPTNIGMYLLSTLTAWDLGYIGSSDLAVRAHDTLDTLGRLERYRGHLLNWYETRSLVPLEPRYVSAVDSGNLAVCLITLKEGCIGAARSPALFASRWDGLCDTLQQLRRAVEHLPGGIGEALSERLEDLVKLVSGVREAPGEWHAALIRLQGGAVPELVAAVGDAVSAPDLPEPSIINAIHTWVERLNHHVERMRGDLDHLFPWLALCSAAPEPWRAAAREILNHLGPGLPLSDVRERCLRANELMQQFAGRESDDAARARWVKELETAIQNGEQAQEELRSDLIEAATRAETLAYEMDFSLLYDTETRLFHIGFNVSADRLDPHFYDLLASEARLASYFAIAKRDVPVEHWFFLGRPVTKLAGEPALVSWNGSAFEYLMPALLLRSAAGTLLAHSEHSAVVIQRRYGEKLGMPWGISESAYAARDSERRYQYRAFGVPGLGIRRGLTRDLVVAPYASALALAVSPVTAVRNLEQLEELGMTGLYGFMEALDFSPERVPDGQRCLRVRSYMAHHQGMILGAIGNALCDNVHVGRFSSDLRMRTVELLLQERVPTEMPPELVTEEEPLRPKALKPGKPPPAPWRPRFTAQGPQIHMLGNGRFASWISDSGAGTLRWHGQALTRWSPSCAREEHGLWLYIHDQDDDSLWSIGRLPAGRSGGEFDVIFRAHLAEFRNRTRGIAASMQVGVAAGDDVEIRRIAVVNETGSRRRLRMTSYAEVVLAPDREDERHPAFSKLFVESAYFRSERGLLFTRRPRHPGEHAPALFHRLVDEDRDTEIPGYETDRSVFFGRDSGPRRPRGAARRAAGTAGWTLDPVMSLQIEMELEPWESRQFAFVTMAAGSRESVLELAERYATLASVDWALEDARREANLEAQYLDIASEHYPQIQALTSLLAAPRTVMRGLVMAPTRGGGQPRLWSLGLSGDLPILLLRVDEPHDSDIARVVLRAFRLWRLHQFMVDLVILRTGGGGYEEPVRERVLDHIREAGLQDLLGRKGGIHLLMGTHFSEQDLIILYASACMTLDDSGGTLARQLESGLESELMEPVFEPWGHIETTPMEPLAPPENLRFENGLGGFSEDASEYVIHLEAGEATPAPWCNVLANDGFGTIVSESGLGFTWALDSGENRLTPWSNDPVLDQAGEVLYLRDEETAQVWTVTPMPAGAGTSHEVRHGAGYTKWRSHSHGLVQELTIFVAPRDPVKVARLRLRNVLSSARRITATYYAEWLLGAMRSVSRQHVICYYDATRRALLAHNPWNPEFGERVAFLVSDRPPHSITTDRGDFLGLDGDPAHPAGLIHWDLGGRTTPGYEPCAAYQVHVDLGAGETGEVWFVLGQGENRKHADALLETWRKPDTLSRAMGSLREHWDSLLGATRVETPDPAFDLMVNRWLLYQTYASRILARAGFYQAGGAIGFRDQLQDMLALLQAEPARARAHILDCAARQFEEGDVLHWWHPPRSVGVRTRFSDDLLWLPYVTNQYVEATGDVSVLDEQVPFLRGPELQAAEKDRYSFFETSPERASLFEHCARALERGNTRGAHDLPLIAGGDWNDGMNRVGDQGQGESVWLGWFAIATIDGFCRLAERKQRQELAGRWKARTGQLREAIEEAAWDGEWYVRAFDDEGQPWGSERSDECMIDSIAQSWSVLSGAGQSERARSALDAAERELVREDDRLMRLLWPPFHDTVRDPGYIKAYPPGIRENGGMYAHAAAWHGLALAEIGEGDGAWRVFDLLNPIRRTASREDVGRYRAEPYVLAADVGSVAPHVGRGGWSWYTGSAAWTRKLGLEGILGLKLQEGRLRIDPCLPKSWGSARAVIREPDGVLAVTIEDPEHIGRGRVEVTVDGKPIEGALVEFPSGGATREVCARLVAYGVAAAGKQA